MFFFRARKDIDYARLEDDDDDGIFGTCFTHVMLFVNFNNNEGMNDLLVEDFVLG